MTKGSGWVNKLFNGIAKSILSLLLFASQLANGLLANIIVVSAGGAHIDFGKLVTNVFFWVCLALSIAYFFATDWYNKQTKKGDKEAEDYYNNQDNQESSYRGKHESPKDILNNGHVVSSDKGIKDLNEDILNGNPLD